VNGDFLDWLYSDTPFADPWKITWHEGYVPAARSVKSRAKAAFNVSEPYDWINCRRREHRGGDFVLAIEIIKGKPKAIAWFYVDFVAPVSSTDKAAFERNAPYQAAQVHGWKISPSPPFTLTPPFRRALRTAVLDMTVTNLKKRTAAFVPDPSLLKRIATLMNSPA
jgi:hypothetical protein